MANKKLSEGVGKKIVEALKKQSEIEITPVAAEQVSEQEEIETFNEIEPEASVDSEEQLDEFDNVEIDADFVQPESFSQIVEPEEISSVNKNYSQPYSAPRQSAQESFINDLDTFEIPNNIAVLKKLITQLPSGVTRHTGAQIIKQTMEALGISMKSVLQEAQQVQDGLNSSANQCYTNIQEYKKQIMLLEKQAQNFQRQYAALNELISLFVQTGV